MDKLVCLLCRHPFKQPKMCSNCSEIFCTKCIQQYVQHHHMCPKCRNILPQLADCTRLIAEVKNHVKTQPKKMYKKCRVHDLPLMYQCLNCQIAICADCGMIEQKHRGHQMKSRQHMKKEIPKPKLRQYLLCIEQSILKDHTSHQQLTLEREVLRSELRWCRNKLKQYYEQMNHKLEEEAQKILREIGHDLEEKQAKLVRLKKLKQDIKQILELNDQFQGQLLQKISAGNQLLDQLQNQNIEELFAKLYSFVQEQHQTNFFNLNRKTLTLLNQVYPEYINHTYQLNYEANQFYNVKYSDTFQIFGQQWRLKIYPKGNGQVPNHLALFLELIDVEFELQRNLIQQQALQANFNTTISGSGKTISKEYRSPFTKGDCWGYNDFVNLQDLPEYLNNGHLIFVVGIRNCSFYDVCDNMKRYIRKLQRQNKVLEELLGGRSLQQSVVEQLSLDSSRISVLPSENQQMIRLN